MYHWISTPLMKGKNEMGTDEYLYQIANQKIEDMRKFLETAIANSVEKKKVKPNLNMYEYLSL